MDDRVLLKVYYFGQILLQISEGVKFVCENSLDIVIPFIISFEELKGVICEKIDLAVSRKISCILYRYPIPVFGGFVQFQTRYITDEASMQEMFSVYMESRAQMPFIELYIEFEQSEADRNIEREDYNSDSEEEFESNYEVVSQEGDEVQGDSTWEASVTDVANALANDHPFEKPSFMRALDLETMHAPEFPEYMNAGTIAFVAEISIVADGAFAVGMEFSSREAIIMAMKDYTIRRGVDYRVYELEPLTFYAKCTQYGSGCDWLIRAPYLQKLVVNIVILIYVFSSVFCYCTGYSRTVCEYELRFQCLPERGNIQVSCFDRQNEVFEVREMPSGVEYTVDLRRHRCDCGEFQVDRIPCRHVFACCANQRLDWQVYVHDVYKMDQIRHVYRAKFMPLGNPTTWPAYNGPRFVPNPFLRRVAKGRPRMTRFLNEMDTRMLRGPRRCRQCGAEGHSRSRCSQAGGNNAHQNEKPCITTCTGVLGMPNPNYTVRYCQNHEAKAETFSAHLPQTCLQIIMYQITT
ncbi:hypothetical protein Ahy_A06g026151 [Arachis hypogaea]|uniref:SWIM-type domain-containing protein n=1 Tax=Arachis hypogaea TaxID=3818 RepID=A0A445CJK6_ARAHY|nr:hypothetical protein Ahy_A06g026151 [Arachis hypogaea]